MTILRIKLQTNTNTNTWKRKGWLTWLEEERLTYLTGRTKVDLPGWKRKGWPTWFKEERLTYLAGRGKVDLPGWKTSYFSFVTTSVTNEGSALAKKGTDATSSLQLKLTTSLISKQLHSNIIATLAFNYARSKTNKFLKGRLLNGSCLLFAFY